MVGIIVIIICVLYLLAIMPRMLKRPDYSPILGWHYAHRGFHGKLSGHPENSLSAFEEAVKLGYGIELDIQLTKDNQVVVFHDFDLKRVCGIDKKVCELNYEELKQYSLKGTKERIPLFSKVLEVVNGKTPLIVELKCKDSKDRIAYESNEILKNYHGVYCIESFHPLALLWYRRNRPDVIRGQLAAVHGKQPGVLNTFAAFLHGHLLFNFASKPDFIAYAHLNKNEVSRNICKNIFRCLSAAWTITSEEEYERCKKDFDLFIFEQFYMKK